MKQNDKKQKASNAIVANNITTKNAALLFIEKNAFFVAVALIATIAFFVFKDFLLFKKAMLYKDIGSDTLNASYPLMLHISNYIHHFGMPSWSFNYGMGQSIFPFFLRDPFDIFIYLLNKDAIAFGIGYIEFSKVILAGTFFFLYLKTLGIKPFSCIIGSLLYSFTGFMILGGGWYIFSFEAMNAALLLLAFEKLYTKNSWWLFPIPIALIGISMPFNLYLYGLFLFLYALLRIFENSDSFNLKALLVLFGKMIMLGIIGLAMSSFFLFENIIQIIESPRGSGGNSYADLLSAAPIFSTGDLMHNATAILRFFSSDILGTGINFKGWNNYLEAPIFYSGLLSLLLFPQVFPTLKKRDKIIYGIFFSIWILPIIFPYFRYAFWIFTGDYYRGFSFFVSLTLIYLSIKALNNIDQKIKINIPVLIVSVVIFFIALSYPYFEGAAKNPVDKGVLNMIKFLLIAYAALLFMLSKSNLKQYAQIILLILLCVELGYMSNITVNKRSIVTANELKEKVAYNDYTLESIDFIKQHDSGFYRIDKNYFSTPAIHGSLNDGLAQDYYGTSSYYSFNQKYYIQFLQAVGIVNKNSEIESRWASGLANRPILESFGSVKYFLDKRHDNPMTKVINDSIAQFGDIKVYKNKYFLPLGFAIDKYMLRSNFDKLSLTQKDFSMLKSFFIDDKEQINYTAFGKYELKDTMPTSSFTWDAYKQNIDDLKKDTLSIDKQTQTNISGNISLNKQKLLLFSIPYDKGWSATIDNQPQEIKLVNAGFSGLLIEQGKHQVNLSYHPRYTKIGMIISILGLVVFGGLIYFQFKK